jgi:hypothetical protein
LVCSCNYFTLLYVCDCVELARTFTRR